MWSLLYNPSAYPSAWTHTSSVVGSCFIYKLGMLTGQRFQAELSPSFLWKFTEFRAETPPHAFGIPNCDTPPRLRKSSPINPPSPSEFQDAARGMVWIFLESPNVGLEVSRYFLVTSYITHSFLLNSIQVNNEHEWSVKKTHVFNKSLTL